MRSEQARIANKMEHASVACRHCRRPSMIEANLDVAIEFGKHCADANLAADPQVRRQLNPAIFEKIYVRGKHVTAV